MNIADIDKNFAPAEISGRDDLVWHDVREAPFRFYGFCDPEDRSVAFHRMPPEIAERVSPGVAHLNFRTAGGRVRFSTDSPYIAIYVETPEPIWLMPHMTLAGSQGFDLYAETDDGTHTFAAALFPQVSQLGKTSFCAVQDIRVPGLRHYTLNFPLYGGCKTLYIGLKDGATLTEGVPYRNEKPVIFYGSSITQGGCASRPGNCYEGHLSHRLNMDYRNLGFSGNAKGEPDMIRYLAEQNMSVFVCDYDHNAPSLEHLQATLPPLYRKIREKQPDLPFIFISSPGADCGLERRDFIRKTYIDARDAGDRNVRFIDGATMYDGDCSDTCTMEGCHPNDLGFYRMYRAILPVLKETLFPENDR